MVRKLSRRNSRLKRVKSRSLRLLRSRRNRKSLRRKRRRIMRGGNRVFVAFGSEIKELTVNDYSMVPDVKIVQAKPTNNYELILNLDTAAAHNTADIKTIPNERNSNIGKLVWENDNCGNTDKECRIPYEINDNNDTITLKFSGIGYHYKLIYEIVYRLNITINN